MTGRTIYQTNSPDEACLVSFAAECGLAFSGRPTLTSIAITDSGEERIFDVLHTVAFTSERKKMSVVVAERNQSQVLVLSKGADSVILSQCEDDGLITEKIANTVEEFSLIGYRTLCVSGKWIDRAEWESQFAPRLIADTNDENDLSNEIESGSFLIGCTAVEDRLQDQVNETLAALRAAGIKVCMITGDKRETAVDIAVNCGLVSSINHVHVVEAPGGRFRLRRYIPKRVVAGGFRRDSWDNDEEDQVTPPPVSRSCTLVGEPKSFSSLPGSCLSAVVEGSTLETILADKSMADRLADLLTSQWFESIVFCRVSPKQKGDIVQLINGRNNKKTLSAGGSIRHACSTLAIGDGANDVNMIKVASIGVGISGGNEGSQAANSSDYSIAEFRELNTLLFTHGRWNFRRMKLFVALTIFKNFCFVFTQYWYASYSDFSGMSVYVPIYLMVYNTVLGVVPLVLMGLFDRDLDARELIPRLANKESADFLINNLIPQCYQDQVPRMKRIIPKWAAMGLISSILIFFITWGSMYLTNSPIDASGRLPDVWMGSMIMYAAEVLVCSLFVLMVCRSWNWLLVVSVIVTYVALFFLLSLTYDMIIGGTVAGMSPMWFGQLQYWLVLVAIVGAICMPFLAIKFILELMFPTKFMSLASSITNSAIQANKKTVERFEKGVL
jgi:phospholipid-translocating P-type ATPase (flippase)